MEGSGGSCPVDSNDPKDALRHWRSGALEWDWGCGLLASPCVPASRQPSTNLWEPMASCGSMWRWRSDIILGAEDTKHSTVSQSDWASTGF